MADSAAVEAIAGSSERRLSSQPEVIEGAAWVRDAWLQLDRLVSAGRLPHGLLLHGRLGTTMTALVETLARRLVCEGPRNGWPCGECAPCRQAEQGSFPDVHRLADDPDHRDIPIDAIRDLIEGAWFTRYGRMRLIVIERVERLNRNSGNALLKLLEEPPEATQFLCTVEHVDRLLPTIRSRLQRLRLREPRQAELADWWQGVQGLSAEQARLAAFVDDPALLEEGDLTFDWKAVTRAWVDLMTDRGNPVGLVEPWLSLSRPALARWLLRLWAAVARRQAGLPPEVPAALEDPVEQLARSRDAAHWLAIQSRLIRFAREAGHPLHPELAVEQLALDLVDPRLPRRLEPGS